ncbi:MAG TPA: dolichyl-phosphate beta-glucosyltransferase [Thermodesulfobacteriota bacterium]|nr:dolichyl-phosphate beta-glucosyltransferase [Thermodesulfobacteriota bacterium]
MSASTPLSIVVPAYNERARLGRTLAALLDYLAASRPGAEVLVVDDGSTDDTARLVERVAAEWSARQQRGAPAGREAPVRVRVLRHPRNLGKGAAVRTGVRQATGRLIVFLDADLSAPPEELPRLLAPLESPGGPDVAIGSRRVEGAAIEVSQPRHRVLIGRLFNRAMARLLVPGVRDTQCGFKGFRREAAQRLFERSRVRGFGFDLEILFLARQLGLVVQEVPIRWRDDARSHVRLARDGLRVLAEVVKILANWVTGRYRVTAPAS